MSEPTQQARGAVEPQDAIGQQASDAWQQLADTEAAFEAIATAQKWTLQRIALLELIADARAYVVALEALEGQGR